MALIFFGTVRELYQNVKRAPRPPRSLIFLFQWYAEISARDEKLAEEERQSLAVVSPLLARRCPTVPVKGEIWGALGAPEDNGGRGGAGGETSAAGPSSVAGYQQLEEQPAQRVGG